MGESQTKSERQQKTKKSQMKHSSAIAALNSELFAVAVNSSKILTPITKFLVVIKLPIFVSLLSSSVEW